MHQNCNEFFYTEDKLTQFIVKNCEPTILELPKNSKIKELFTSDSSI